MLQLYIFYIVANIFYWQLIYLFNSKNILFGSFGVDATNVASIIKA